ncbi:hypothetical protein JZ751_006192 [Albula glossodonta]|uniref:Uncharacterized protein n=1 Tax=Albula glossodonta TaxID=121402 RepID=A0A8T2N3E7_9TELE|nr:hypothetical protein JZ751_006192 [Albula glossodonta]
MAMSASLCSGYGDDALKLQTNCYTVNTSQTSASTLERVGAKLEMLTCHNEREREREGPSTTQLGFGDSVERSAPRREWSLLTRFPLPFREDGRGRGRGGRRRFSELELRMLRALPAVT